MNGSGPVGRVRALLNDERVRFLIVGGVNTVVGYLLFALLNAVLGWQYLVALVVSYVFATLIAFLLHRRYTFRVHRSGNILVDLIRFEAVYAVLLAFNTVALWLLVDIGRVPPLLAQAIVVVVSTVLSFVGNKLFSFRRRPPIS